MLASPLTSEAQSLDKAPRVGVLWPGSESGPNPWGDAFRRRLQDLSWVEGQNIRFEQRFAGGRMDRLPSLAAELVALKVDVLVTISTQGVTAARNATRTIPIVMVSVGDAVAQKFVASLAHPGGNITGHSIAYDQLFSKRLELIKDLLPRATRVAVLVNTGNPFTRLGLDAMIPVARTLKLALSPVDVQRPTELDRAFREIRAQRADALVVVEDATFFPEVRRIAEFATKARLPTIGFEDYVRAGGLMAYGVDLVDLWRRAATYVDKILRGAKPADLPVERPTKFALVINLKTAKALGLTIPPVLLVRADEVIR